MSGIVNKVKEALHSDKSHETGSHATTGHNDPEGVHGPHGSRVANAADPRVDSDRDHRAAPHHTAGTAGVGTHSATHGAGAGVTGYNDPEGTHGPHSSRIANAADPRVDSDRDHRAAPTHHTAGAGVGGVGGVGGTHSAGHTGAGVTGHTGNTGLSSSHTAGGAGVTGYNDPAGTHGPHSSRVANAADPRVDSDRDHRGAPGTAGTTAFGSGPGPAANTAGPHKSDLLNKADPRVDSDLDGSKTIGGNKTMS